MIANAVTLVIHNATSLSDEQGKKLLSRVQSMQRPLRPSVSQLPPKDKHSEIYDTVWFKPSTGVCELLHDFTFDGFACDVTKARNVRFVHDVI